MTGAALGATALALAVLVGSPHQHRRTPAARPRPAWAAAGWAAGGAVTAGAALLGPTTVLAAAILAGTVGLRYRRRCRHRCAAAESQAVEAALNVLVGELRAGADPVRAFSVAAAETGATAVAAGCRAVAARARLGADVAAGLRSITGPPVLAAYWERLAVCWQLAHQHGLAMSTLMCTAQRDIAERQRFSAQVGAGMAGTRATATILAGLPVLGLLLGQLIGAAPLGVLLGTHAGGWLLVLGVALTCVGLLWADRIADRVTS